MEKKPTKRDQQAAQTKARISLCAHKLIEEQGYENVSIQSICKAAGVSVGGFYHYFPSKDDLLLHTYVYFDNLVEKEFSKQTFSNNVEAITALIMGQLAVTKLGVSFQSNSLQAQLRAADGYFFNEERYFPRYLRQLVGRAMDSGEIHPSHGEEAVAQLLLQTSRGVLFDWALHKGAYSAEERTLEIFHLLFPSLHRPKEEK